MTLLKYDREFGRLDIDLNSVSALRLRLYSWEIGLQAERIEEDRTERFDGDVGIPLAMLARSGEGGETFVAGVPADVRRAVAPFAWRQWIVLRLLRRDPRARELLTTAPAIVWLVSDAVGREHFSLEEAADILLMKRRAILGRLGLPAVEWAVRLLSRVRFARYLPDGIETLQALLATPELIDDLRARPGVIVGESLRLMFRYPELAQLPFAHPDESLFSGDAATNVAAVDKFVAALHVSRSLLSDLLAMVDELGRADVRRVLGTLRTVDDLRALHDRWARHIHALDDGARAQRFAGRWGTTMFPAPPVLGSEVVVPITCFEELALEGRTMRHCVGSYGDRVMSGKCYIYKVLRPERATLEIVLHAERGATVGQLKLANNQVPSKATYETVERWLTS